MFSNGTADSEQLAFLANAFQDYCREQHIEPYSHEAEDAGRLVMTLFANGARTPAQMKAALALTRGADRARLAG
jgi:hypothetical protein